MGKSKKGLLESSKVKTGSGSITVGGEKVNAAQFVSRIRMGGTTRRTTKTKKKGIRGLNLFT